MGNSSNWLFGNLRYSLSISLVSIARDNGIESYAYLNFIFERPPAADSLEALDARLRWNVQAALPVARRAA